MGRAARYSAGTVVVQAHSSAEKSKMSSCSPGHGGGGASSTPAEAAAAQGVSNDETPPPTNRRSQKQKSTKAKSTKRANAAAVAPTAHTRADNTSSASPSSAAGVRQQPPQFSVAKLWSDTVGVGANTTKAPNGTWCARQCPCLCRLFYGESPSKTWMFRAAQAC